MIFVPWLADIALVLFARYGFEDMPVSRIWLWAIFLLSLCPFLNIIVFFAGLAFVFAQAADNDVDLKDCKFNRYFFNKHFND